MKILRTDNFKQWLNTLLHDEKGRVSRKIQLVERVEYRPGEKTTFSRDVQRITETDLIAIPTGDLGRRGRGHWVVFSLREDEAIFLGGIDDLNNRRAIDSLQQSLEEYKAANPRTIETEETVPVSGANTKGAALLEKWAGSKGGGIRR